MCPTVRRDQSHTILPTFFSGSDRDRETKELLCLQALPVRRSSHENIVFPVAVRHRKCAESSICSAAHSVSLCLHHCYVHRYHSMHLRQQVTWPNPFEHGIDVDFYHPNSVATPSDIHHPSRLRRGHTALPTLRLVACG